MSSHLETPEWQSFERRALERYAARRRRMRARWVAVTAGAIAFGLSATPSRSGRPFQGFGFSAGPESEAARQHAATSGSPASSVTVVRVPVSPRVIGDRLPAARELRGAGEDTTAEAPSAPVEPPADEAPAAAAVPSSVVPAQLGRPEPPRSEPQPQVIPAERKPEINKPQLNADERRSNPSPEPAPVSLARVETPIEPAPPPPGPLESRPRAEAVPALKVERGPPRD